MTDINNILFFLFIGYNINERMKLGTVWQVPVRSGWVGSGEVGYGMEKQARRGLVRYGRVGAGPARKSFIKKIKGGDKIIG